MRPLGGNRGTAGLTGKISILVASSVVWVAVALLTRPDPDEHLEAYYREVRPGGWWGPIADRVVDVETGRSGVARRGAGWLSGMVFLYRSLLGVGRLVIGRPGSGIALLLLGVAAGYFKLTVATERGGAPAET